MVRKSLGKAKPKSIHVQMPEHSSKKQVFHFMPPGKPKQNLNADFRVCKFLLTLGTVVKYMPQGSDGSVIGLMQYSREEVWYKLGRKSTHFDAEVVYFPKRDGYVVSSITKG